MHGPGHPPRRADRLLERRCRHAREGSRPGDGEVQLQSGIRRGDHVMRRDHHGADPAVDRIDHLRLHCRCLDRAAVHWRRRARPAARRIADGGHLDNRPQARLPPDAAAFRRGCGTRTHLSRRALGALDSRLHRRRYPLRHLHADRSGGDHRPLHHSGREVRLPLVGIRRSAARYEGDGARHQLGHADDFAPPPPSASISPGNGSRRKWRLGSCRSRTSRCCCCS